jgi:hypothetical protein
MLCAAGGIGLYCVLRIKLGKILKQKMVHFEHSDRSQL